MDLLQLKNAGKATHRINRLMTAISNIRDRSVQVATKLLDQSIVIEGGSCPVEENCPCCSNSDEANWTGRLVLTITKKDKEFSVVWKLCKAMEAAGGSEKWTGQCRCRSNRVVAEIAGLFDAASPVTEESGTLLYLFTIPYVTVFLSNNAFRGI